jgi:hypothetical protein
VDREERKACVQTGSNLQLARDFEIDGVSFWRGYTPPMKMDGYQNKGVAGGAFCKWLKGNGMDGGKSRRSNQERVEKKRGRGVPYPGYFAKCAEAIHFKRVGRNTCLKV